MRLAEKEDYLLKTEGKLDPGWTVYMCLVIWQYSHSIYLKHEGPAQGLEGLWLLHSKDVGGQGVLIYFLLL